MINKNNLQHLCYGWHENLTFSDVNNTIAAELMDKDNLQHLWMA